MLRETEISAMPMQRNSLGYQQQKNTYNTFGSLKGSWVMDGETKFGTKGELGFAKFQENRFNINGNVTTKDWDINDVGFSTRTNFEITTRGMVTEFCSLRKHSIICI
jgi:hypothetical protein